MNVFDYLVEVESEAIVRSLRPDFTALGRLPVRGVIVTARSASPEFDFVSRFFAPAVGRQRGPGHRLGALLPGPVLGRAAGQDRDDRVSGLGPRGRGARPPGPGAERVLLGGQAVTVLVGELLAAGEIAAVKGMMGLEGLPF